MKYRTFAIDFDETIYSRKDKALLPHAARVIQRIKASGGEVVIWTCRTDEAEMEAKKILRNSGIDYDAFNDMTPFVRDTFGSSGRKIWTDVYIDDASIHCRNGIDWLEIEKWIWGE